MTKDECPKADGRDAGQCPANGSRPPDDDPGNGERRQGPAAPVEDTKRERKVRPIPTQYFRDPALWDTLDERPSLKDLLAQANAMAALVYGIRWPDGVQARPGADEGAPAGSGEAE